MEYVEQHLASYANEFSLNLIFVDGFYSQKHLVVQFVLEIRWRPRIHYSDVIMRPMASQVSGVSIVYSTVCSGANQRKYQSSASLAFVRGIHRWPVDSLHKGPVTRKCSHLMTSSCNDVEFSSDCLHELHSRPRHHGYAVHEFITLRKLIWGARQAWWNPHMHL